MYTVCCLVCMYMWEIEGGRVCVCVCAHASACMCVCVILWWHITTIKQHRQHGTIQSWDKTQYHGEVLNINCNILCKFNRSAIVCNNFEKNKTRKKTYLFLFMFVMVWSLFLGFFFFFVGHCYFLLDLCMRSMHTMYCIPMSCMSNLVLLQVNTSFLENEIEKLNGEGLLNLKVRMYNKAKDRLQVFQDVFDTWVIIPLCSMYW